MWKNANKSIHDVEFTEVKKIHRALMNTMEKLLPVKSSEEMKLQTIMMATALNCQLEWMCKEPQLAIGAIQLHQKILDHVEKYANDAMGAYAKIFAWSMMTTHFSDEIVAATSYQKAMNFFSSELGKNLGNNCWDGAKTFGVSNDEASHAFTQYQNEHTLNVFREQFISMKFTALKKIMDQREKAIADLPCNTEIIKMIKSEDLETKIKGLEWLDSKGNLLITEENFKQANHVVAVAIYHSVKIRRNLPPDSRTTMDTIQCDLSGTFSQVGELIIDMALMRKRMGGLGEFFDGFVKEKFVELTELVEDGIEAYANQFPNELPKTYREMKPILKRAISWNKRAISLCTDPMEVENRKLFSNTLESQLQIIDENIEGE